MLVTEGQVFGQRMRVGDGARDAVRRNICGRLSKVYSAAAVANAVIEALSGPKWHFILLRLYPAPTGVRC